MHNQSSHFSISVEGTCSRLPAGVIYIDINVGKCYGEANYGECYFGWNSYTHIMVSETFMEREIVQF